MAKKVLSAFLAILLVVLALPAVSVYAAEPSRQIRDLINSAPLHPMINTAYEKEINAILAECGYGQYDTYTVLKNCYDYVINNTKTVTSVRGDTTVKLTIGTPAINVNGVEKALDVPAQIVDSRTLVPVRAIAEAYGCDVSWDDATKTVTVVG